MKTVYRIFLSIVLIVSIVSCSDFLDRESDSIFTDDQIFSDEAMIKSALANFYGRIEGILSHFRAVRHDARHCAPVLWNGAFLPSGANH